MTSDHTTSECCCVPGSGDCCGPGSWCCARAGDHHHDDLGPTRVVANPIRAAVFRAAAWDELESLVDRIGHYLPSNYTAAEEPLGGGHAVVAGWDHAGWGLDTYVLHRLASGLIFPIGPEEPEACHVAGYERVLNRFVEGYEAAAEDDLLDEDPDGLHLEPDPVEGRIDCIDFVIANFELLSQVELESGFGHGVDFYLTRNGHGTGFWDRGYGDIGRQLTDAAKTYGPTR